MTADQRKRIEAHGEQLLRAYPAATERDPLNLCRKLRRLESKANAIALRQCNGPLFLSEKQLDAAKEYILEKVRAILGNGPPVFINMDPRGYALKVRPADSEGVYLHRDWGGYAIIAPEIN